MICRVAMIVVGVCAGLASGADWPQFRGVERDGHSPEKGLLKQWPEGGPRVVWKVDHVGIGYSSLAVVGDRVYTQGDLDGTEQVICLSASDGAILWKTAPTPGTHFRHEKQGDGPRGTPTVDGPFVYTEGGNGDVTCLEAATGKIVWKKSLRDLGGKVPGWGYSESPLVLGDALIVTPGGGAGTVAALNKKNGELLWQSRDVTQAAGYSSPQVAEIAGVRQIVQFSRDNAFGITADSGKLLWTYNKAANRTANITMPVIQGNFVFVASAYNTGGGLVRIDREGAKLTATEIYFNKRMQNHHGGIVLVGDTMYGFGQGGLIALGFEAGEERWVDSSVRKGSLIAADGMLYCLGERHDVALVEANPAKYTERGRFRIADLGRPSWAHPVISGGRLYIRNLGELTVYDVKGKATAGR